jgi:hypothetical protein
MMVDPDEVFQIGKRFRLSALGKERCPRLTTHTGVIVGQPQRSDAVRVLLDGRKFPITLHASYIEAL